MEGKCYFKKISESISLEARAYFRNYPEISRERCMKCSGYIGNIYGCEFHTYDKPEIRREK